MAGRDFRRVTEETLTALDELRRPSTGQLIDGPVTVVPRAAAATAMVDAVRLDAAAPDGSGSRSPRCGAGEGPPDAARPRRFGHPDHQPDNPYHWVTVYRQVDEIVDESDPERGHLATESIDELARLYVDQYLPLPHRGRSACSPTSRRSRSPRSGRRERGTSGSSPHRRLYLGDRPARCRGRWLARSAASELPDSQEQAEYAGPRRAAEIRADGADAIPRTMKPGSGARRPVVRGVEGS